MRKFLGVALCLLSMAVLFLGTGSAQAKETTHLTCDSYRTVQTTGIYQIRGYVDMHADLQQQLDGSCNPMNSYRAFAEAYVWNPYTQVLPVGSITAVLLQDGSQLVSHSVSVGGLIYGTSTAAWATLPYYSCFQAEIKYQGYTHDSPATCGGGH